MADKKSTKTIFVAHQRRSEINGHVYNRGDEADLSDLSDEQIGYLVGQGYYGVVNPETLTEAQAAAIEKEKGG